jgi:tRNA C32,U32 (ribose-2'-O)-methylase TrmJ
MSLDPTTLEDALAEIRYLRKRLEEVNKKWGTYFTEVQVQKNRVKMLKAIITEIKSNEKTGVETK